MPSKTAVVGKWTVTPEGSHQAAGKGSESFKMLPGDIVMNDEMVVHFSFFFAKTQDSSTVRSSLSRLLAVYRPLAGRIQRKKEGGKMTWLLEANDEGVSFKEVTTSLCRADFADYPPTMRNKGRFFAPLPFQKLSISRANSGKGPLLKVLLLQLRGGGSILTLSANHTGIDAGALGHLLMRWSLIAGGSGPHALAEAEVVPLFDREVYLSNVLRLKYEAPSFSIKAEAAMLLLMEELMEASMRPPPTARQSAAEWGVILSSLARTRRGPGMPVTTPILHIPKSDLAHLKDQLMRASGRRLSTNDALCALMWHVCCALRGRPPPGQGSPQQGYMVAIVDLRGRHLPEAYCGAGYLPCNIPGGANTPLQRLQRKGRTPPACLRAAAEVDAYCSEHCKEDDSPASSVSLEEGGFIGEGDAESQLAATAVRIRLAVGLMADAAVVGRLASRLVSGQENASPLETVLCTARGCVDADMLSSSWTKFPFLEMDLGNGKAEASYGLAVSRKPYIWNNFMAPDGGMYVAMHVATPKEERLLKQHPWWPAFLPGARFMP